MGAVISLVIITAGIGMIGITLNDILERENSEVTDQITKILCEEPKVQGRMTSWFITSARARISPPVHLSFPTRMTVKEVDALTRRRRIPVMKKNGRAARRVRVDSYNTMTTKSKRIRRDIRKAALPLTPGFVHSHGFTSMKRRKRSGLMCDEF